MSNYSKSTNFTAKDALASGNPSKIIKGSEFDTEFDAIATAVATKLDSTGSGANLTNLPIVQVVEATPITAYTDVSTVIPEDGTIPQNTEGFLVTSATITPSSTSNILLIEWTGTGTINSTGFATVGLFQDSTASAIAGTCLGAAGGTTLNLSGSHSMTAGTTSATTFRIRVGPSSGAGNFYVNGRSGAALMGGIAAWRLRVIEITP